MKSASQPKDPFRGLAESVVTSNTWSGRHAFDLTVSHWTSAGTASPITLQVSNEGQASDDVTEASWSAWTSFTPSASTAMAPILGMRWYRLLRTPSLASTEFRIQTQEE